MKIPWTFLSDLVAKFLLDDPVGWNIFYPGAFLSILAISSQIGSPFYIRCDMAIFLLKSDHFVKGL